MTSKTISNLSGASVSSSEAVNSNGTSRGGWIMLVLTITAVCLALVVTVHKLNKQLETATKDHKKVVQGL